MHRKQIKNTLHMNTTQQQFVAYYRVSTNKQGLGLDAQQTTATTFAAANDATIIAEYSEKESAKHSNTKNRTQLFAAIEHCKRANAVLLIAKLDRLSRSVEFLFHLKNTGINFVACDVPELNALTLSIFAGMAQHERELISQRTKAALTERKKQGTALGSHNGISHCYTDEDRAAATAAHIEAANNRESNRKAWHYIMHQYQTKTATQLARELNNEHYSTPSGRGNWNAKMVQRIIERYQ